MMGQVRSRYCYVTECLNTAGPIVSISYDFSQSSGQGPYSLNISRLKVALNLLLQEKLLNLVCPRCRESLRADPKPSNKAQPKYS